MSNMTRRAMIAGGVVGAGAVLGVALTAAGRRFGLVPPDSGGIYGVGETLAYASHRVFARHALAREFPRSMISAKPFANSIDNVPVALVHHEAEQFANWNVAVTGQVNRRTNVSLADLRAMGSSSQITEVACEEGWSYVAEWTGTPVSRVLERAGVRPTARFLVYYSAESGWWDAIDLDEAMHPQTLLAWQMNGAPLPVPFGGPVRMRVPRQLGYKSVKFINRLELVDSLDDFPMGSYSWYAGI